LLANEEDTVSIGQDLFRIEPGNVPASSTPPSESKPSKESKNEEPKKEESKKEVPIPAQPQQQSKADKPPSASKSDISKQVKPSPASATAASLPGNRGETRVKMNRMRVTIANRLKQSQNVAASLTTFNEVDMSALMAFRKKYKDEILKTHDVKLGFMSAFAKASTLALKEIPAANAYIEVDLRDLLSRVSLTRCHV
jgi:2-oxoglutarate dehydrogenase E2 component (dihydrolipoamide succinyltransferase)